MLKPTIGLEIHAELKTKTKMFCGCLNDAGETHPNINVCPVCAGHPGTLPTINKEAVKAVLKLGLALGAKIAETTKFDRKNYFYPDLPKGYQISQYDRPLVESGVLVVEYKNVVGESVNKAVRLRRIHLEEDTGRLLHLTIDNKQLTEKSRSNVKGQTSGVSLVDFNRAGVPLMELVTEPDIEDALEAKAFAQELRRILRYLEISDADMERGQMRVEANISLAKELALSLPKDGALGTKVEVKNLNSFRAVEEAIGYEIKRQTEVLESGGKVRQETRGWNENSGETESQRSKEEAHDYRYFPEPDLPPFEPAALGLEDLKIAVPELPAEKRVRFAAEFSLSREQAALLAEDRRTAEFFEEAVSELLTNIAEGEEGKKIIQTLYNYFMSDLRGLMNEKKIVSLDEIKITPENLADLAIAAASGEISSRAAKDILAEMFQTGADPRQIAKDKNLGQISDAAGLKEAVLEVIKENEAAAGDFKKGKQNALQFLVGKAMAKLKGRGNPEVLRRIFEENLSP
ncbi:MAG: Asp-tRNA(Asn)/Glu-tRNA(Gln) amidotransferase subunit GatB [Parcubacteria group bacterium]|nr:Asp-tRNA(Asn)/Glu-tRNA(Gln) amidotransferase subunit GatB [Parcubacteria group bacterium]